MPPRVKFGPILDHTAVNTTYPRSCLRTSASVDEPETSPVISRLYAGTLSLQDQNLDSVVSSVLALITSGKFSDAGDGPSCLESWTVLQLALKQSTSSSLAVNQINAIAQAAQRDFEQFKDSCVVESRVLIQILRVMDLVLQLGNEASRSVDKSVVQYFLATAISLISRQTSSKSLLGVCLHIYNTAHSPRLLTSEQVKTLVAAVVSRLQFTNTALTGELLFTIRTLYSDHRQILVANCSDWVVTIAKYMFDSNSYLRQHALGIFNDVNRKVGGCREISRALHDTFNDEINGELFINFACRRLSALIAVPADARSAFSIWSSVMLALISWGDKSTEKLQQWKHLSLWIEISRQGFQSVSFVVREAAVNAWKTSVYVFAFAGRPEQNAKNLPSLLQPLQMLSSASPALAKRLLGTFNSLLFVANRVQSQSPGSQQENYYDTVWNSLVAPGLACFFQSPDNETRILGVAVLKQLLTGQDVFKQGPRLRVLQTDIPTEEIGKLPMSWVNSNCLTILNHCSKHYANLGSSFTQIWQCIIANLTATISKSLTVSDESLSLLATMASFLRRSELSHDCLHGLSTSLVKAIGVKSSLNWKFGLSNDLVLPKGGTPFLSIMLDFIYSLDDQLALQTSLLSFVEKADSRDTLEIIKLASTMPVSEQQWLVLGRVVESTLWMRSESVSGFDQAVISVLLAAQKIQIKDWTLWITLFDKLLKSDYVQEDELVNLLQKPRGFWPSDLGRAFVSCNANALRQSPEVSQSVIRLVVCDSDPLSLDLSQMTRYFCIQFARQLVSISCKTTLLDFEAVLKCAVELLDSALVENSDVFASALRSNVISNKLAAQRAWQTYFCDADPAGTWTDRSVMAFAQLHADGIISGLPASFPMSCTTLKRKAPEPLSPSTPKRRSQQQVQCISPPPSDDLPTPSLALLHRLRSSSWAETEKIKREASEIKLEHDEDWYITDLSSSPPAAEVSAPVFSAEQEQLSSLRRNLLGIDMKSSLTSVSEPELLFLERLMMDSLVSLRQNIRSRGISLV